MDTETWLARFNPTCNYCGGSFNLELWKNRHSDEEGEDVHAECCQEPDCKEIHK